VTSANGREANSSFAAVLTRVAVRSAASARATIR
jgi:hypothetical protein